MPAVEKVELNLERGDYVAWLACLTSSACRCWKRQPNGWERWAWELRRFDPRRREARVRRAGMLAARAPPARSLRGSSPAMWRLLYRPGRRDPRPRRLG